MFVRSVFWSSKTIHQRGRPTDSASWVAVMRILWYVFQCLRKFRQCCFPPNFLVWSRRMRLKEFLRYWVSTWSAHGTKELSNYQGSCVTRLRETFGESERMQSEADSGVNILTTDSDSRIIFPVWALRLGFQLCEGQCPRFLPCLVRFLRSFRFSEKIQLNWVMCLLFSQGPSGSR